MIQQQTTDFGFKTVEAEEKATLVGEVFDSVADRYDLMNDIMSLGIHRLWKRYAVALSAIRRGHRVLDLAGGTGDLTRLFANRVGDTGQVILADVNGSMLALGRRKLIDRGILGPVAYVQADAEQLPFPDRSFHCVSIAFGLRNVTRKSQALRSMRRILRPGGQLLVLEFSKLTIPALRRIYDAYSFGVLPVLGRMVAGDGESYRYLAESIRMHPDQEELRAMMMDAGLERCTYHNLTGGVVALHRAYRL